MTEIWIGYILSISMLDYTYSLQPSFYPRWPPWQYLPTLFLRLKRATSPANNMCTSLEVISGGGRGREEENSLHSKHHTCWCLFPFTRDKLREEKITKLTHTHTHTHTSHTCCSVSGTSWAPDVWIFLCCPLGKNQSLLKVLRLFETGGLVANFCWEGGEWVRGGQKNFALVRQNIMQLLCVYVEFRISESASSGYRTFQFVMQGTNPLCLLSSWPTRCGISCITSVHGRSGSSHM